MKGFVSSLVVCATMLVVMPASEVAAKEMAKACRKSDRDAATRRMCNCIQQVADQTLSTRDQKLAASFFAEPHKSQEIRQSARRSHEKFWLRYKEFGVVVSASCSHLAKR